MGQTRKLSCEDICHIRTLYYALKEYLVKKPRHINTRFYNDKIILNLDYLDVIFLYRLKTQNTFGSSYLDYVIKTQNTFGK